MPLDADGVAGLLAGVDRQHRSSLAAFAGGARRLQATSHGDDATLAGFSASVELTAVAAYSLIAAQLTGVEQQLARTFGTHHQDHADAWNRAAGTKAARGPNAKLLAGIETQLSASVGAAAALGVALTVEQRAAATYQSALETFVGAAGLKLAASILPVEAQHGVVLGVVLGKTAKDLSSDDFQTKDGAIDPAQYAVD